MTRLAFLASYNGSSAKAIVQACQDGILSAEPVLMLSNNKDAKVLQWATDAGLHAHHTSGQDEEVLKSLQDHKIDMVILSGYMKLIGQKTIRDYPNKIINIHPALLPKYGGKGMYGSHVHKAVKESGDTVTGPTIHYVDEVYDNGAIIAQKEIPVLPEDTAETIEDKVKAAEPEFYVETLKKIII
ncbi:MAG: phosphoribosylglycinamide formyltransferase [Pseudomonadota bacterium]